ncbi:MAG: tetratricopeptide (TPR) repeat protein [Planctomycetota bacterium]|jgi:tetratricopeptide (TPR) repeat protein
MANAQPSLAPRPAPLFPGLCLLLAIAYLAWAPRLDSAGFSYDDLEMLQSPVVDGSQPWTAAFTQDAWHHRGDAGHWRPGAVLSLRADLALHGPIPGHFARTNVLLHHLALALAAALLRLLTLRGGLARGRSNQSLWHAGLLGLAIFAAHPALADSVAWISGRTSMGCAIGGLLGAVAIARETRRQTPRMLPIALAATIGLALALLFKEDALTFVPAYILLAARAGRRGAGFAAIGAGISVLLWIGMRFYALGAAFPPSHEAALAGHSVIYRLATGCGAFLELLRVAVMPLGYPPTWRAEAFEPRTTWAIFLACAGALLFLSLLSATLLALSKGRNRVAAGGACVALLGLVPVLQLVPLGEVAAPRFLYLPLIFAAPLIGLVLQRTLPKPALLAIPLLLASTAHERGHVYDSRLSYWQARLPFEADSPQVWNALGNAHLEAGDSQQAREFYLRSTEIDPDYSRPWAGLGMIALEADEILEAETYLMRAVEAAPRNPVAWSNAGALWLRVEAYAEAEAAYRRATKYAPGRRASWRGLVKALEAQGKAQDADTARARLRALGQK